MTVPHDCFRYVSLGWGRAGREDGGKIEWKLSEVNTGIVSGG
jgi:hypothetical protein